MAGASAPLPEYIALPAGLATPIDEDGAWADSDDDEVIEDEDTQVREEEEDTAMEEEAVKQLLAEDQAVLKRLKAEKQKAFKLNYTRLQSAMFNCW